MQFSRGAVKKDGKSLLLQGYTVSEISELYQVSRDTILTYNKSIWKIPLRKQITLEQMEMAKEMILQGYTYKEIADEIGFKASTIADKNNKHWHLPYYSIQISKKMVERICKTCGKIFYVRMQKLKHDACNYCCKKCSHIGAIKPNKIINPIFRGYRWAYLSLELRKKVPFCQRCGTTKSRLCVHHIKPWRLGGTNNRNNLLVLCDSCHRVVETGTREIFDLLNAADAIEIVKQIYKSRMENLKWNLNKLK